MDSSPNWPDGADGDVFRRLKTSAFDFSKHHIVDYNVDFNAWPPSPAALELLAEKYGELELFEPEEDSRGYVLFKVTGPLSYEGVVNVQRSVTAAMQPYGGVCESWGVLHYAF